MASLLSRFALGSVRSVSKGSLLSRLSRAPRPASFTAEKFGARHVLSRTFGTARVMATTAQELAHKEPAMDGPMFCFQCEQTKGGTGCETKGVCGKTPETATLQDLLTYSVKGLSCWAHWCDQQGVEVPQEVYTFLSAATFATLTNVNFDDERFKEYIQVCHQLRDALEDRCRKQGISEYPPAPDRLPWFDLLAHPADWRLDQNYLSKATIPQLVGLGKMVSLEHRRHMMDPTLLGLHEMLNYGLRGMCAYTHHAEVLGMHDIDVDKFVAEAYTFLCSDEAKSVEATLGYILKCGEVNLKAMRLLDQGHTSKFGHPEPTQVRITPQKGKAILVSGHDLQDTHDLLEQTKGTGIQIWTHGELLPAHGYPELKKYPHLAGNYGGAWYRQQRDFETFPGAILMTTNCIIEPRTSYKDRIFTTGEVGWSGVNHIQGDMGETKDYSQLINKAQELPGFTEDAKEEKFVTTGFARNAVMGVAGDVIKAVKEGNLRHIFLIGGCDGTEPERRYFTKVADLAPDDTMILTLGCGKFRFYDKGSEYGMLKNTNLPRLLDMGQCNDAYSAIAVAGELAKAFGTDVNGLPLSLDLSWLEQKAVAVLLTLLHLGVRNIRIGPKPPAFLTPEALQVVVDKFGLKVTATKDPAADVEAMLQKA